MKVMIRKSVYDEIMKSHKYSRKEFKDGKFIYYYDKHNNFARMTQCKTSTLKINASASVDDIVNIGLNYINKVWLKDWNEHPEKSICKELGCRKISFADISFEHISKQGKNPTKKNKNTNRNTKNLMKHIPYLPCAKELLEENGVHTQSRYEPFVNKRKGNAVGIVYQTVSGIAPNGSKHPYISVTVSQIKYNNGRLSDTVYISVVGENKIKKSLALSEALCASPGRTVKDNTKPTPAPSYGASNPLHDLSIPQTQEKSTSISEILKSMANEILPQKQTTPKSVESNALIVAKSMGTNDYLKSIKNQFNFEMMKNLII